MRIATNYNIINTAAIRINKSWVVTSNAAARGGFLNLIRNYGKTSILYAVASHAILQSYTDNMGSQLVL